MFDKSAWSRSEITIKFLMAMLFSFWWDSIFQSILAKYLNTCFDIANIFGKLMRWESWQIFAAAVKRTKIASTKSNQIRATHEALIDVDVFIRLMLKGLFAVSLAIIFKSNHHPDVFVYDCKIYFRLLLFRFHDYWMVDRNKLNLSQSQNSFYFSSKTAYIGLSIDCLHQNQVSLSDIMKSLNKNW